MKLPYNSQSFDDIITETLDKWFDAVSEFVQISIDTAPEYTKFFDVNMKDSLHHSVKVGVFDNVTNLVDIVLESCDGTVMELGEATSNIKAYCLTDDNDFETYALQSHMGRLQFDFSLQGNSSLFVKVTMVTVSKNLRIKPF